MFGALLALRSSCSGQDVMSIEAYRSVGKMSDLDTLYRSAVDADPTRSAFGDRQDEFVTNYNSFYRDLNSYLAAHDFVWDDTTRCFNKLYFHPDGRMDKYLYGFRGQVPGEKQKRFEELTRDFLKGYRFPMTAPEPFRQCGPSTFLPKKPGPPDETRP